MGAIAALLHNISFGFSLRGLFSAIIAIATLSLTYYSLNAFYQIFLSPLRHIPGPKARAFSFLPTAISGLRGREPYNVRDLHLQYGPVLRVNPTTVSFISAPAWKEIYGYPAVKKFTKSGYAKLRSGVSDLLTADGEDHARQRAAVSHAFSEKALRGQEPHINSHIDLLIKRLDEKAATGEAVNMVRWFEFVAFDIIGDLLFSFKFNCLQNQSHHPWVSLLMNFFRSVSYVISAKMFGMFMPVVMFMAPMKDLLRGKDHLRMSYEKVQQRLAMPEDPNRNDFWTYILRHNQAKEGSMSVAEMEVNGAIFLPAGSETIATALSGICYLLLRNPQKLAQLRTELETEFSNDGDITISRLTATSNLKYLKAVIDEGLRMFPPFSGPLKRTVPPEGATICGTFIPGGTFVSVYALAAYDNPQNFARPYEFTPERWLTGKERPEWSRNDMLDVCQPFSIGPRNCIGMNLAYAEMKMILSRLVFKYDLELLNNDFEIEKQRVYIMREKPELKVKLTPRR